MMSLEHSFRTRLESKTTDELDILLCSAKIHDTIWAQWHYGTTLGVSVTISKDRKIHCLVRSYVIGMFKVLYKRIPYDVAAYIGEFCDYDPYFYGESHRNAGLKSEFIYGHWMHTLRPIEFMPVGPKGPDGLPVGPRQYLPITAEVMSSLEADAFMSQCYRAEEMYMHERYLTTLNAERSVTAKPVKLFKRSKNVYPWKYNSNRHMGYTRTYKNEVFSYKKWVGIYLPLSNRIDYLAPEPKHHVYTDA